MLKYSNFTPLYRSVLSQVVGLVCVWGLLMGFGCATDTEPDEGSSNGANTTFAPTSSTSEPICEGGPCAQGCTCDDATDVCPGFVQGRVTDFVSGQPLTQVQVGADKEVEAVDTDVEGRYSLEVNVCRSPYTIEANLQGYCGYTNLLNLVGDVSENNIVLDERVVRGRVLDMTRNRLTGEPFREPMENIVVAIEDSDISDTSTESGSFVLGMLQQEGDLTLVAQEAQVEAEGEGCYETTVIERVQTCVPGPGVLVEMVCKEAANNGCGLCCTGERAQGLPEGARPGEFCQREEPCRVGEEPVWVCDPDLRSAQCSCADCPEDNSRGEVCDGRDNDCDGTVDNPNSQELLLNCEAPQQARIEGCVEGGCKYLCEQGFVDLNLDLRDGAEGDGCECALSQGGVEVCDGLDNDCDGVVDEIERPCETVCGEGIEVCVQGVWGVCTAPMPEPEVCDGVDNDCNGTVDDDPHPILCDNQMGACAGAVASCASGLTDTACSEQEYRDAAMAAGVEYESIGSLELLCDGIDNNCDGYIDENCCDIDMESDDDRSHLTPLPLTDFNDSKRFASIAVSRDGIKLAVAARNFVVDGLYPYGFYMINFNSFGVREGRGLSVFREDGLFPNNVQSELVWDGMGFRALIVSYRFPEVCLYPCATITGSTMVWRYFDSNLEPVYSPPLGDSIVDTLGLGRVLKGVAISSIRSSPEEFLIAWSEGNSDNQIESISLCSHPSDNARCIRLRRYNSSGQSTSDIMEITHVYEDVFSNPIEPRLVENQLGGGMVSWQEVGEFESRLNWRIFNNELLAVGDIVSSIDALGPNIPPANPELNVPQNMNKYEYDIISSPSGYIIVYAGAIFEGSRWIRKLKMIRTDLEGGIISERMISDVEGDGEQRHPILVRMSDDRISLAWWSGNRLMHMGLDDDGNTISENVVFVGSATFLGSGSFDLAPHPDPNRPERNVGAAFSVLIEDRVHVGMINADGHLMCIDTLLN